jgi:hypothetical protein
LAGSIAAIPRNGITVVAGLGPVVDGAVPTEFDDAHRATAVAVGVVAIVAPFGAIDDAIAAPFGDLVLAISIAAVAKIEIAIVAPFPFLQNKNT